ncbi:MAG: SpoIIIAH-like family protein [Ruminococcus sp.]|nr:SpoIIIAH-like family protein [Ruminococcus sp.]
MKFHKRHIVLAALILALGGAVFINWQFSDDTSLISDVSKELGAATYVNADVAATDDEVSKVSKQTSKSDEYFAKAEVEREQSRDSAIETAQEILKLSDSSDEAKTLAVEQLNKLEDNIVTETNIENILKAKGFSLCLCMIADDSCSVAVLKEEIVDDSPLIIKDAVLSQLDIEFNNITIIEV